MPQLLAEGKSTSKNGDSSTQPPAEGTVIVTGGDDGDSNDDDSGSDVEVGKKRQSSNSENSSSKKLRLHKSHVVMLRRLQQTPLPGQKLPKFPGNRPSPIDSTTEGDDRSSAMDIWERQANAFALVMVTMNSPWTATNKCKYATNIHGFQQMMLEYDNSEASIVCKGRGRQ